MNLGITGTRNGMTDQQQQAFIALLRDLEAKCTDSEESLSEFLHGSCQGADVEAARIARDVIPYLHIVARPGLSSYPCRTFSGVDNCAWPEKPHFARNRDIVDYVNELIVFPPTRPMPDRGGTRYTHDYAVKRGKPVWVIWPDGTVEGPAE